MTVGCAAHEPTHAADNVRRGSACQFDTSCSERPGGATMARLSLVRTFLLLLVMVALHAGPSTFVQAAAVQPGRTAESYVAEGDRFARSREYDKAIDAYRQALRINPALAPAHHGLG